MTLTPAGGGNREAVEPWRKELETFCRMIMEEGERTDEA